MSQYKIEAVTAHHPGDQLKQHDYFGLFGAPKAPGYMMAVLADGAGNGADGGPAAEQVVRTARQNFEVFSPRIETVEELLETIAREAHTLIQLNSLASRKEPYSTMTVLIISPEKIATWAHIGDTRLYRFKGAAFQEHTNDDAHIDNAIQALRQQTTQPGGQRINILNVLGDGSQTSFMTISQHKGLQSGDAFLLCSDGLWRYTNEEEIGAAIAHHTPRQAAELLIATARTRGEGQNMGNCTLAIIRLVALPPVIKSYTTTRL